MRIIVSGSLAYDRIMDFPGYFKEHILPDKIHGLNVCFQVNGLQEKFGGTAGNIAYALALMGQKPEISAAIGRDGDRYLAWLAQNGISTKLIRFVEEELTAGAYITTDRGNNQITGFHPGAMKRSSALDFEKLDPRDTILIISPGNLEDMVRYPRLCKTRGIGYIFDPGQSLPMLTPEDLVQAVDGCSLLIVNDYEMDLTLHKTGLNKDSLLARTRAVIVTAGEKGSVLFAGKTETRIPAAKPDVVKDPTGAGDSYRGGLIAGLLEGKELEFCARMGSVCASFAVECHGTQEYRFTSREFHTRFNGICR